MTVDEEKKLSAIEAYNATRTQEERREGARQAGLASGASRRRAKSMREAALALLSAKEPDPQTRRRLAELGLDETIQDGLLLAMRESAKGGSVEAFKALRDTSGQAPKDVKDVRVHGDLSYRQMSDEELLALAEVADEVAGED